MFPSVMFQLDWISAINIENCETADCFSILMLTDLIKTNLLDMFLKNTVNSNRLFFNFFIHISGGNFVQFFCAVLKYCMLNRFLQIK